MFGKNDSASTKGFGETMEKINVAFINKKEIKEFSLDEYLKSCKLTADSFQLGSEKSSTFFRAWSLFPFITRDIAMWVHKNTDINDILEIIKANSGSLLVRAPQLFDKFEKDEKVSYAWHLVFQSFERNLTDLEIAKIMENITKEIEKNGFILR